MSLFACPTNFFLSKFALQIGVMSHISVLQVSHSATKHKPIAQVHDSILFEVAVDEVDLVYKITEEVMNYHYDFYEDMAMTTDMDFSSVWGFGKDLNYWKEHIEEWRDLLKEINYRNDINEKGI